VDAGRDIIVSLFEFLDWITFGVFDFGIIEGLKAFDPMQTLRDAVSSISAWWTEMWDAVTNFNFLEWMAGTAGKVGSFIMDMLGGGEEETMKPDFAAAGAKLSGGAGDPARFITGKVNADMQMDRKLAMMDEKRQTQAAANTSNVIQTNNFSQGGGETIRIKDPSLNPFTNLA